MHLGDWLCLDTRMAIRGVDTPKHRRRPLRCWLGFHGWRRYRNATFYCTRCPATKAVDPATGKSVVDGNRQLGRWT